MGWDPRALGGKEILILSTHGGIRARDGTPIALGYHTGHWEVGLLMEAAAEELKALGAVPFAGLLHRSLRRPHAGHHGHVRQPAVSQRRGHRVPPADPLAAHAPRRDRRGHLRQGPARHDDGAGRRCTICRACWCRAASRCWPKKAKTPGACNRVGARFAHSQITLEDAAENLCRACATPGGGCQFLGTAATSQVVGEALGMSLPHSALAPSGHPIWLDMARRSARAVLVARSARPHDARHSDGCCAAQRHGGARGVRRIDQPDPAPAGHRACGRAAAAHRGGLDRGQSRGAAPGGCAAQRSAIASHGAGVPGRRRARGDAAPAARGPAGHWMC